MVGSFWSGRAERQYLVGDGEEAAGPGEAGGGGGGGVASAEGVAEELRLAAPLPVTLPAPPQRRQPSAQVLPLHSPLSLLQAPWRTTEGRTSRCSPRSSSSSFSPQTQPSWLCPSHRLHIAPATAATASSLPTSLPASGPSAAPSRESEWEGDGEVGKGCLYEDRGRECERGAWVASWDWVMVTQGGPNWAG